MSQPLLPRLALFAVMALSVTACGPNTQATTGGPVLSAQPPSGGEQEALLPIPPAGSLTPDNLKGLTATQIEGALGAPSFRRRDPPAEIWQYRVHACTLDLFLYDEGDSRVVAHFAVRSPGGTSVSERACLDEVLARQVEPPTS